MYPSPLRGKVKAKRFFAIHETLLHERENFIVLQNTFLHIPGVGPKMENRIWESGIRSWREALAGTGACPLPARIGQRLSREIEESLEHFILGEAGFFTRRLPSPESWRLFPDFPGRTAFLDIETDGLSPHFNSITVIGLYDGERYRAFIRGKNLEEFPAAVRPFSLLVTFNGSGFDLPFLRARFGREVIPVDSPAWGHLDLRFVFRRLGYSGGLKRIEPLLGIERDPEVQGVDGYMAVVLWGEYLRGSREALSRLVLYNFEDTVNLAWLAARAYNLALRRIPFSLPELPLPGRPRFQGI